MPTPNTQLRRERQLRGWSQAYLAQHIGVHDYYISRWERGDVSPSPYYQQKLCELFGKTAEELGLLQTKNAESIAIQEGRVATIDALLSPTPSLPLFDEPITDKHEVSVTIPSSSSSVIAPATDQDSPEYPPSPPSLAPLEVGVTASQPVPLARPKTIKQQWLPLLILVTLLVVLLLGRGAFFLARSNSPLPLHPFVAGHLYFLSSGQVNDVSNQGITDQVSLQIHLLSHPSSGKSDYAWLLPDEAYPENPVFPLGTLILHGNSANLSYSDLNRTNLLALTSRFLVTEEDATIVPLSPSTDTHTWRYIAQVPSQIAGGQTYSFLDHLRHLLAADPKLHAHQLPGGLAPWLYHNVQASYAQAINAKELWRTDQMTSQIAMRHSLMALLYYLEGTPFLQQALPAVPPALSLSLDPKTVSIGMLQMSAQQDPPGYLDHVTQHLVGLSSSPGATTSLREQIASIMEALNTVNFWLQQTRRDAEQLIGETGQPLSSLQVTILLNDLVTQMSNALMGRQDTGTGKTQEGVEWITQAIEGLATVEITPYSIGK